MGKIKKYKMREGGSEKKVFPPSHILLNGIALTLFRSPGWTEYSRGGAILQV